MRAALLACACLLPASAAWAEGAVVATQGALSDCRTSAANLHDLATQCRAEGCSITFTETIAGQEYHYDFSPDVADSVADTFTANGDVLEQALPGLEDLDDKIIEIQDKISELGFQRRGDDYAQWLDLAEDARKELDDKTRDIVMDKLFDAGLDTVTDALAGLSRGKADKLVARLGKLPIDTSAVQKKLRKFSRIKGRRKKVEAAKEMAEDLKELWDQTVAAADARTASDVALLILGELVTDPRLELLITEIDWTTSAVYAYAASTVAEEQIDRLTELNESDLKALKSLTELLVKRVKEFRLAMSGLHGCSYTNP